jgi:hypothetical protein
VFEYTGNYRHLESAGVPTHKPIEPYMSEKFYTQWKAATLKLTKVLRGLGVRVIWMQVPQADVGLLPWTATLIPRLNAIYRQTGTTIDAFAGFGGSPASPGLHDAAGLHLSDAGKQRMAELVVAAIG